MSLSEKEFQQIHGVTTIVLYAKGKQSPTKNAEWGMRQTLRQY